MLILDSSSPTKRLLSVSQRSALSKMQGSRKRVLVLLPGDIAARNFSYAALGAGTPSEAFLTSTLEDLALDILDPFRLKGWRILERPALMRLIVEIIRQSSSGSLADLSRLPLDNPEVQETLLDEFEEYLRCCDVDSLQSQLVERAKALEDPFARGNSLLSIEAFRTLEQMLRTRVASTQPQVLLSRSHLLRRAGERLPDDWPEKYANSIGELFVASISIVDASALKFLMIISEMGNQLSSKVLDVRIFQGKGTYTHLLTRLTKAGVKVKEEGERESPKSPSARAILDGGGKSLPDFIAAPERRREVEAVARRVHKLLAAGVHPSEILLVARDSGRYVELVNEILPAYGIPCYIQTRRPFAHLPPYRFVKSTLDLIAKISESQELDWPDITDPLRLGFCLPGGGRSWPLQSKEFTYLEESLSIRQQGMQRQNIPKTLPEWKGQASRLRWRRPRELLSRFLEWIEKQANLQIAKPSDAESLLSGVLGTYMYRHSTWTRESISPRLSNPGRFIISGLHPTSFASRIRGALSEFAAYLEDCMEMLNLPMSWSMVAAAFGEFFGKRTYGLPEQDTSSVKMVDAGNTAFLQVNHLFLMGLRADEFPRKCPNSVFLPEDLRKAVNDPAEGEGAILYLRGSISDYDNEVDFLELSLKTCRERVTCSMPYLDERGHVQAWSTFVDFFKPDQDERNKIPPGNWLPEPKGSEWTELAKANPPWVRRRLFCHHANRRFPSNLPQIDIRGVSELASTIDPKFFERMLGARIKRYLNPPKQISVSHNEPWFSQCSLKTIIGSPLRSHEIDLHAHCPMQLYFWQFLFLWDGDGIDRDTIPTYFKRPHWKLGRLPKRISYVYPSDQTVRTIAKVTEAWPQRQENLSSFHDRRELKEALSSLVSGFDSQRLTSIFEDELALVRQERRDNIRRDWSWLSNGVKMNLQSGEKESEVILPPHRIDTLRGCKLILTYVNFSRQLKSLFCGKEIRRGRYELSPVDDPLKDYNLPILINHYSKSNNVAGGVYVEFFEGARQGYYNQDWLPKHKGRRGYEEELRVPYISFSESRRQVLTQFEWKTWLSQLEVAIKDRIEQMIPDPDILFSSYRSSETCGRCVYDNLCQIPKTEGF